MKPSRTASVTPAATRSRRRKLIDNIDTSWAEAKTAGAPPPLVFGVSQNDCLKFVRYHQTRNYQACESLRKRRLKEFKKWNSLKTLPMSL